MPTFNLYLPQQLYSTWRTQPKPVHPVAAAWLLLARWIDRRRQRKVLAGLDDHQLRDIGITRLDAMRECEKPFWK